MVDMRERELTIKGQEILTADKVSLRVSILVQFRVTDAKAALHEVENYEERLYSDVQLAARRSLASMTLDEILTNRNQLSEQILTDVKETAAGYGVSIRRADVKDLIFPGNLQEVMERYVSFQRVSLTFRKKLISSLIYPGVLLTLVSALMVFMFTVVVPQFAKLYDQLGNKLPGITLDLLAFGTFMQKNVLWLGLGAVIAGVFAWRFSSTEKGRDVVDGIRIGMPVAGKIWVKYQVAQFSRTLSTLLTGGLPLVPSLETSARSISSRRVSKAVYGSITTVREGKSLAESLAKTDIFPLLATDMITVGEQTGALPQMLNSVAEFFEEDVQTALTASLALIEPAILMVMGVVVVVILIGLYLPIFSLSNASNFQR